MVKSVCVFTLLIGLLSCGEGDSSVNNTHETTNVSSTLDTPRHPELHQLILIKDSLLFDIGFNQIDTSQVADLIAQDFEFYHDEHGITDSKDAFLTSIAGLSELPFKTWRTLKKESVEIFPLYSDNKTELYGILQTGIHEFYQQHEGEEARKTSTAQFSHLWILEEDAWKLKRVISFDHINSI